MQKSSLEKVAFACTAICSLIASGVVPVSLALLLITLSSRVLVPRAFGQSTRAASGAGVQLEAGIAKEEGDGDLKAAMTVYQQVASDQSAPRAVRAKALLRLAGCEEKLGQQARGVYERILQEYADQAVAGQARTRVAALNQQDHPAASVSTTLRKIDPPPSGQIGVTDTDGKRGVYRDSSGHLYFGDLAGRSKRLIFESKDDFGWVPSRDFSSVLLLLGKGAPQTLATINTDGTGFRKVPGNNSLVFLDWSRDKRYILAKDTGGHKLVLLRVADGKQRQLAAPENNKIGKAAFSPDRRFIAFSTLLNVPSLFSVPFEGGKPESLRENAQLLDWTSDGRFLVIATERNGARALSLQPVEDGKASGDFIFVRYASCEDGYVTANGSLVYSTTPAQGAVSANLAKLDAKGRPGSWKSLDLRPGNAENPLPVWSPDSKQLLYMSRNDAAGHTQSTLVLRELSTGQEREIYKAEALFISCTWSAEPNRIMCGEAHLQRTDFLSVALDSGQPKRLGSLGGIHFVLQSNPDGTALDLSDFEPSATSHWDIATGRTSLLEKGTDDFVFISKDENWLARRKNKIADVEVRPGSGGTWSTLAFGVSSAGHVAFTPDSDQIFFTVDEADKRSLFRVAVRGGAPERLGDYPSKGGGGTMSISPDGKNILAVLYESNPDLSILENFVPSASRTPVKATQRLEGR